MPRTAERQDSIYAPWTLGPATLTKGYFTILDSRGVRLAVVRNNEDGRDAISLITAAPELLEALKHCVESLESLDETNVADDIVIEASRAAIAKAERTA